MSLGAAVVTIVLTEDVEVISIPTVFGTDITTGSLRRGKGGHSGGRRRN